MPPLQDEVKDLVVSEVSEFAKVPKAKIQMGHRLSLDLGIVKPALVFLAQSLRAHIQHRNPAGKTLLVTEIEKPDFMVQQLADLVQSRLSSVSAWHSAAVTNALLLVLVEAISKPHCDPALRRDLGRLLWRACCRRMGSLTHPLCLALYASSMARHREDLRVLHRRRATYSPFGTERRSRGATSAGTVAPHAAAAPALLNSTLQAVAERSVSKTQATLPR
jgi:hypothetical protein